MHAACTCKHHPPSGGEGCAGSGDEGAWGALDAIGGTEAVYPVRAIRASGTVMLYGALGGPTTTVPTLDLLYAVSTEPNSAPLVLPAFT